ncbi:MAG TPA: class A beta-lactamase-related serine hydrolase [Planctomycetes bacterium]|nr:class A beta-lactamase-related serine hydrolase [Planctomycetota bacterium]
MVPSPYNPGTMLTLGAALVLFPLAFVGAGQEDAPGVSATQRRSIEELFRVDAGPRRPGYAFGVVVGGRLVLAGGSGYADLGTGRLIGPATPFRLASASKQFTAACALLLIEEGELREEQTIGSVLPGFEGLNPAPTVSDLIHHTSGIRDYLDLHWLRGEEETFTPTESLALLARQRSLAFAPESAYAYSNSNYFLLGAIVGKVSGSSLARFARAGIFDPLGMKATRFVDDHRETPRDAARGYWRGADGWEIYETELDHVGDGGLYSTIEDLARWAANFSDPRLGSGSGFLERELSAPPLRDGRSNTYAFGLAVEPLADGSRLISHGGSFAGYRSAFAYHDASQTAAIVLANFPAARTEELAESALAVLGVRLERVAVPDIDPAGRAPVGVRRGPSALAGSYRCSELDTTWELEAKGSAIAVRVDGTPLVEFKPDRRGTGYRARDYPGMRLVPLAEDSFAVWSRYLGRLEFRRIP